MQTEADSIIIRGGFSSIFVLTDYRPLHSEVKTKDAGSYAQRCVCVCMMWVGGWGEPKHLEVADDRIGVDTAQLNLSLVVGGEEGEGTLLEHVVLSRGRVVV